MSLETAHLRVATDSRPDEPSSGGDPLSGEELARSSGHMSGLVAAVQELSLAPDMPSIAAVVKRFAREFTGADGATFILRDGDLCYYMDEDAISPLWKGQRFPMKACVSGWVMAHRTPAIIEDIYDDPRVPVDAYRPTFVKSLAVTPIRRHDPLGAIGAYWARHHAPSLEEVTILGALADTTAVAIQNVQLHKGLAEVQQRARELESVNRELDAFAHSVAHDLQSPLRALRMYSELMLKEKADSLDLEAADWARRISGAGARMSSIIGDLLRLSSIGRNPLAVTPVPLSDMATSVVVELGGDSALAKCRIEPGLVASGDPGLLRLLLENLFSNALKYSSKAAEPRIEFGAAAAPGPRQRFFVKDNGVGMEVPGPDRLFKPFQRFHSDPAFQGTGLGLATAKRIVDRHQGVLWIESAPGAGTTLWFELPRAEAVG